MGCLKMTDYPVWMSLPLEYQDDIDILDYIRYCRGEPPYEHFVEVFWLELTEDDFGGPEEVDRIIEMLKEDNA